MIGGREGVAGPQDASYSGSQRFVGEVMGAAAVLLQGLVSAHPL